MLSPPGWAEPGQRPEFSEYTLVLRGAPKVKLKDREFMVKKNQASIVEAGERVQYSTPEGTEYVAICIPAFSPQTVRRDER